MPESQVFGEAEFGLETIAHAEPFQRSISERACSVGFENEVPTAKQRVALGHVTSTRLVGGTNDGAAGAADTNAILSSMATARPTITLRLIIAPPPATMPGYDAPDQGPIPRPGSGTRSCA